MEATFLKKRFIIVAGKGGVGKSTLCAALGLACARAGKRTIIAELNTRQKAPMLFGKEPHGYEPLELRENLWTLNIQPEPALHEYALRKVRFERVYQTVFQNEAVHRLLRMIPGMTELLLLGKAFDLERERDSAGGLAWDMVIVDAPATGHGVSLLRLPQAILEVVKSGPMADEVRAMRDLLVDPKRTTINLVTLPEEMPVRETAELMEQVRTVLQIPTGYLFVNAVWPEVVEARDAELLRVFRSSAGGADPVVDRAMDCVARMAERRRFQEGYLDELARLSDMPRIHIPFLFVRDFGPAAVRTIADHVVKEAERLALSPDSSPR